MLLMFYCYRDAEMMRLKQKKKEEEKQEQLKQNAKK